MSADNWAVCPRCIRETQKKYDKLQAKVKSDYGKIPADKYLELVEEAAKPIDTKPAYTFREDYEIGIYESEFEVIYSGSCAECGLSYRFSHKVELEI